ncbi:MAG TPA: hypothetical protein PL123_03710 [Bacteroidales bacterium]|nr:hypothetical protein [Bacteroidales bacterium]
MKNIFSILIALMITVSLSSQGVDANSKKLIDTYVKSNTEAELSTIDQAAVSKVFTGTFFKGLVGFIETGSGLSYCGSDVYFNINGTTVTMIETIHTDIECPVLMSLIKKEFLLKDENSAKLFEAALNTIYPVEENESQDIKHLKKGAQWIFVRKKFFDDFTVFIVTTAANGAITKIDATLGYAMK